MHAVANMNCYIALFHLANILCLQFQSFLYLLVIVRYLILYTHNIYIKSNKSTSKVLHHLTFAMIFQIALRIRIAFSSL